MTVRDRLTQIIAKDRQQPTPDIHELAEAEDKSARCYPKIDERNVDAAIREIRARIRARRPVKFAAAMI